jgi:hypothetical protein
VLTLRVVGGGLVKGSVYVVSVTLRNNAARQASPSVSIVATVRAWSGPFDGEGVVAGMESSTGQLLH